MTTVNSRQIRSLDLIILGCLTSNFLYLSVSTFYGEVISTGGDNSNKVCFGRNTKFFRESGDFAGNRETWDNFRKILDIFGTLKKKTGTIHVSGTTKKYPITLEENACPLTRAKSVTPQDMKRDLNACMKWPIRIALPRGAHSWNPINNVSSPRISGRICTRHVDSPAARSFHARWMVYGNGLVVFCATVTCIVC